MSLLLKLPTEVLNEVTRSTPATVLLRLRITCTELHALNFPNASAILGHHFMTLCNEQSRVHQTLSAQWYESYSTLHQRAAAMETLLEASSAELDSALLLAQHWQEQVAMNKRSYCAVLIVTAVVVLFALGCCIWWFSFSGCED